MLLSCPRTSGSSRSSPSTSWCSRRQLTRQQSGGASTSWEGEGVWVWVCDVGALRWWRNLSLSALLRCWSCLRTACLLPCSPLVNTHLIVTHPHSLFPHAPLDHSTPTPPLFFPAFLHSKSELLVVLKQPEGFDGPTQISLITDNANHLVLHWGTCKPGE